MFCGNFFSRAVKFSKLKHSLCFSSLHSGHGRIPFSGHSRIVVFSSHIFYPLRLSFSEKFDFLLKTTSFPVFRFLCLQTFLGIVSEQLPGLCLSHPPLWFLRDSSLVICLFLSSLMVLHLLRKIGLYSLGPGVNHDSAHLPDPN